MKEKRSTARKLFIAFWIVVTILGFYILWTNPAEARSVSECERWAYNLGEDNYPDSIIMHSIGCDNNGQVGGKYYRVNTECAAHARRGFRKGLDANSPALVNYVQSFGCIAFEDGTYGRS